MSLLLVNLAVFVTSIAFLNIYQREPQLKILSPQIIMYSFILQFFINLNYTAVLMSDIAETSSNSIIENWLCFNFNISQSMLTIFVYLRLVRICRIFLKFDDENSEIAQHNITQLQSQSLTSDNKEVLFSPKLRRKYFFKERDYALLIKFVFLLLLAIVFVISFFKESKSGFSAFLPAWIEIKTIKLSSSPLLAQNIIICITLILIVMVFSAFLRQVLIVKAPIGTIAEIELLFTGFTVIVSEILVKFNHFFTELNNEKILICLNLLNLLHATVVIFLIMKIKNQAATYLIYNTKESACDFDMLLVTEKTYICFQRFLKNYHSGTGQRYLELYTDLNVCKVQHISKTKEIEDSTSVLIYNYAENIFETNKNTKSKHILKRSMLSIYQKYLEMSSPYYVEIPSDLLKTLHASYTKCPKNMYSSEWDQLIAFVHTTLKEDYFEEFKSSSEFQELVRELETEEKLVLKLIEGSIIEN